ncbi:hypothetical protein CAPTEDRAFT_205275 [Capitella teleta]|uniref:EGF-like domain-containing protein n=1 Tax=Capitella teleta TaxID=283909 RepID=R7VJV0_CAPTE|nr:hypothetical protein CAPTEDRAFT_205275 [Capitella teleta]|eukprot:ELU16806.1 hypothetical protein CAPTEDRAFT_205275 [Capitella teleta]
MKQSFLRLLTAALLVALSVHGRTVREKRATSDIQYCTKEETPGIKCVLCDEGEILASDQKSCLECPSFCSDCRETNVDGVLGTVCKDCDDGYALHAESGTCKTCGAYCSYCKTKGDNLCDDAKYCLPSTVYNLETSVCEPCADNCMKCSEAGSCDEGECSSNYVYVLSESGTSASCKSCAPNCRKCDVAGEDKCDPGECYDKYALDTNSQTCSRCTDNCKQCSSPDECNPGMCNEGFIYRSDVKDCRACPPNCLECEFVDDQEEPVCTVCNAKFEVKEEKYCDYCPANCNICKLDSTSGDINCQNAGCKTGYALYAGQCYECPPNCNECTYSSSKQATECRDGMCIAQYAVRDGLCYKCPDNCKACTSTSSKTICTYNMCMDGTTYKKSDGTCPQCPSNCASCYLDGKNNIRCGVCDKRYVLVEDTYSCTACPSNCMTCAVIDNAVQCLDQQCAEDYVLNPKDGKCIQCDTGCKLCTYNKLTGDKNCLECASSYKMDDKGVCIACPAGCRECEWNEDDKELMCKSSGCMEGYGQSLKRMCTACPEGCASCTFKVPTGKMQCDDCENRYKMYIGKDASNNDIQMCIPCPKNCLECTYDSDLAETVCVTGQCVTGYTEVNGHCEACADNCGNCESSKADKCDECNPGYILSTDKTTCDQCATNCKKCSTMGKDKCDDNECMQGYTHNSDNTACLICADEDVCKSCDLKGSGKCDSCQDGYIVKSDFSGCVPCPKGCSFCEYDADVSVEEGVCVFGRCKEGYIMNPDRTCKACPTGCAACHFDSSVSDGVVCNDGKCRQNYVQNPNSDDNICVGCPGNCVTCYLDSAGEPRCDWDGCKPNFLWVEDSDSCEACADNCTKCSVKDQCDPDGCVKGSAYESQENKCIECADHCLECDEGGKCKVGGCDSGWGYDRESGICKECTANCNSCDCTTTSDCLIDDQRLKCSTGSGSCANKYSLNTDARTCEQCDANCNKCSSDDMKDKCDPDQCKDDFFFNTTSRTCISKCQCAHLNNNSLTNIPSIEDDACAANCHDCNTNGIEKCDSDGCDQYHFFEQTNSSCKKCADNCEKCEEEECDPNCTQKNNAQGVYSCSTANTCMTTNCQEGYGYNSHNKCDDNCKICDTTIEIPDLCDKDECKVDYGYERTSQTCKKTYCKHGQVDTNEKCNKPAGGCLVTTYKTRNGDTQYCPAGYCMPGYVYHSGTCQECPENCATCYYEGTTTKCEKNGCLRHYARTSKGLCIDCEEGCLECSAVEDASSGDTISVCDTDKCSTSYELIKQDVCIACSDGCAKCTFDKTEIICSKCRASFLGLIKSPQTSEWNQITDMDENWELCIACPLACAVCTYDSASDSMQCVDDGCIDAYAMRNSDKTCHDCPAGCEYCKHTTGQATACVDRGCYTNRAQLLTSNAVTCFDCPDKCARCEYRDGETWCLDQQCEDGYGLTRRSYGCIQCPDGCLHCNVILQDNGQDTYVCTDCNNGYVLHSGACHECPTKCGSCTYDLANQQTICTGNCEAQYARDLTDARKECKECPVNCDLCTYNTATANFECDTASCKTGYGLTSVKKCGECPSNCKRCDNNNEKCDECDEKYVFDNNKCSGFSVVYTTACAANCEQCNSAGPGKCDNDQCEDGYVVDESGKCARCADFCSKCSVEKESLCDANKCLTGYCRNDDKICVDCPDNCKTCEWDSDIGAALCLTNECYAGYGLTDSRTECKECPFNCKTCEDNGHKIMTCTECLSKFVLNGLDCGNCPQYCLACSVKHGKGLECDTCQDGSVQLSDGSCQLCSSLLFSNCIACTDVSAEGLHECTKCSNMYSLNADKTSCLSCRNQNDLDNCNYCIDQAEACAECKNNDYALTPTATGDKCGVKCYTCLPDARNPGKCNEAPTTEDQTQVCSAAEGLYCWSFYAIDLVDNVPMHYRGCYNQTCTDDHTYESCNTVDDNKLCQKCFLGNLGNGDLLNGVNRAGNSVFAGISYSFGIIIALCVKLLV